MRSVNQNHHLYVAKAVDTVSENADTGTIQAFVSGEGEWKDLYFKYKGHDGVVRSDLIPLNQITYAKYVPEAKQRIPLRKVEVTLDSTINSGAPVVGQDYILNIAFQQFYGLSPEDTYVKTVALHITSAINSASAFYTALANELNAAFAREVGASASANPYLTFTASSNKLTIEEKEQPWSLGKWEAESLMFEVIPSTIYDNGEEVTWGNAEVKPSTTFVKNNKRMADLEWFTFGERADFYRGMGYPNNFNFIPMVNPDPSVVAGYASLEIHYAYQGSCEDIQKSEKDITIIGATAQITALKTALETLEILGEDVEIPTVQ